MFGCKLLTAAVPIDPNLPCSVCRMPVYSCRQKSAYSNGSASAQNLGVNAVRNASGGEASQCLQTSCALAA